MSEKLGPCPLCGGEATALAAQNKRMREALERCSECFRQLSRGSEGDDQEAFEIMKRMCDEAIKGGGRDES